LKTLYRTNGKNVGLRTTDFALIAQLERKNKLAHPMNITLPKRGMGLKKTTNLFPFTV
jgi:hypothetical protein